jgi:hypothetical protein
MCSQNIQVVKPGILRLAGHIVGTRSCETHTIIFNLKGIYISET